MSQTPRPAESDPTRAVQGHAAAYARSLALQREAARARGKERLRRAFMKGFASVAFLIWMRFDLGTAIPYIDQVVLGGMGQTPAQVYYPLLGALAFLPNVGRVLLVHWRDTLGPWLPVAVLLAAFNWYSNIMGAYLLAEAWQRPITPSVLSFGVIALAELVVTTFVEHLWMSPLIEALGWQEERRADSGAQAAVPPRRGRITRGGSS